MIKQKKKKTIAIMLERKKERMSSRKKEKVKRKEKAESTKKKKAEENGVFRAFNYVDILVVLFLF